MEQEALSAAAQQFTDAGATLVLISPQFPEHSAAIAEEKGLNIDILSDPGNDVAARYGLKYQMPADLIAIYQQFGRFVCQHNALINNIIDITRFPGGCRLTGKIDQAGNNYPATKGFFGYCFQFLIIWILGIKFLLDQHGGGQNSRQGVVDFMGNTGRQKPAFLAASWSFEH